MGSREKGKEEVGTRVKGVIYGGLEGWEKLEAEAPWLPDRALAPALLFTPV